MAMNLSRSKSAGRAPPRRFVRWSFSRWWQYIRCPAQAKYKHLDKLPEGEPGPALARGSAIHELIEGYLTGKVKTLPTEAKQLGAEYRLLKALGPRKLATEQSWGFTKDWQPCAWNDWDRCWLIVKTDATYVATVEKVLTVKQMKEARLPAGAAVMGIDDHKTGKVKLEENERQLELYATTGLQQEPDVAAVRGRLLFVDHGEVADLVVLRKDAPRLIKLWNDRVKPMLADTRFAPKPGQHCTWCAYSKSRGGPCQY